MPKTIDDHSHLLPEWWFSYLFSIKLSYKGKQGSGGLLFKGKQRIPCCNRNYTALISSLLVSELPDSLLLNPVNKYFVGFFIRKRIRKLTENDYAASNIEKMFFIDFRLRYHVKENALRFLENMNQ